MTNIIKKTLGYSVADTMISAINSNLSKFYYFIGKSTPLTPPDIPQNNSRGFEAYTRNEMVFMKRISSADISLVVDRIDWEPNKVFSMYTSFSEQADYYCVNADFSVYKCLDNNAGSPSLIEPTSIGVDSFYLSDGYKWKFLYNIPSALRNKFLTAQYMPVLRSVSANFFSDGGISNVSIINHGAGYTQRTTSIVVNGNGTGAKLVPIIKNGQLVDVIIENAGSGYSFANIEVESTRTSVVPATVTAKLSVGDVNTSQALVEMLAKPGTIESATIISSGTDYTSANVVIEGDGTGATGIAEIGNGKISKLTITNSGKNYTQAKITIQGNGTGATIYPNISPATGHGRDAVLELNASTIMFYQNLEQQRFGSVVVDNDFSQFGIIRNPLNKNFGKNIVDRLNDNVYSVICDFSSGASLADFLIGAQVYIVKNAEQKMFKILYTLSGSTGSGMVLQGDGTEIQSADQAFSAADPLKSFAVVASDNQTLVGAANINCCFIVGGQFDYANFPVDSLVRNAASLKEFRVISVDAANSKLMLMPLDNGTIIAGDTINKKDSLVSFVAQDVIEPVVDRHSGEILFIENRLPFNQTNDQSVTFRSVLKF